MTLVPPSGPGVVKTVVDPDGAVVVWRRNDAGFLTCTVGSPDTCEDDTGHVTPAGGAR